MARRPPIIKRSVQTSRGDIDYYVYDFIMKLERKPVIWNRMHIDNKNAAIVEKNWLSFAQTIVPFIKELDEDEQNQIIEEFKTRWYYLKRDLRKNLLAMKKGTSGPCHYLRLMEFFLNSKKKYLKDILSEEEIETLRENEIIWRNKAGLTSAENENNKRTLASVNSMEDNAKSGNGIVISPNKRSARLQQKRIDKIEIINETQTIKNKRKLDKNENRTQQVANNQHKSKEPEIAQKPLDQSFGNISFDPMSFCETFSQPSLDDVNIQNDSQFDYRQQQQCTDRHIQNYAAGNSLNLQDKTYDAHQAFFDSIKPTLRNLSDTQKLDFKIEVLKTLKKYKLY